MQGINEQEKGVNKLQGKYYTIFKSEKSFKGYSKAWRTLRKKCAKEEKKSNLAKPARTEQL